MFGKFVVGFCLFISILSQVQSQGIGDRLLRTALLYVSLPLTADNATSDGWQNYDSSCIPGVGYAYSQGGYGPSKGYPITTFFTSSGQIAGIGMSHYNDPVYGLDNFWIAQQDGSFLITVSFRDPNEICSGEFFPETIGDRLVVNQGAGEIAMSLPLTSDEAQQQEFTQGGCIGGMGTHWSYDLSTAPQMSWNASNLLPVVTMYNQGVLSAFFITTPVIQYSEPFGPWEGPIISALMCYNWCDSSCSWNVNFWSVNHFYVTDHSNNNCASHC